ncbi:60S ribosomal protein L6 [Microthyrium microscopicum]|uniref:60S ribosomal protein L6 n=1 Tax=Microthyrium microscopicum TaxID=703497 RepID=A0A6A6UJN0_9PEZI|nr:60S ribosomal protein L6 [Microthyrium microscopicum]
MAAEHKTKKFGKGERTVPHHSEKASKWYPAEDERQPKKVRKTARPAVLRDSLQPGQVLILLAGRFRGKRVILLSALEQGVLLVTGPFKVNGVPIRRVNARYVIATSTNVNVKGIDKDLLKKLSGSEYFAREKSEKKTGEEAFFKQGDKPEKKETAKGRVDDQKNVDKAIISEIKKQPLLASYLAASFSLRKGDKPHEMVF